MDEIKIDEIRRQLADISVRTKIDSPGGQQENFNSVLEKAVLEVNSDQQKADQSVQDYISGRDTNLHNTLLSLEKADLSFKLMMQVRNKLVEAYKEIMHTNV